MSVLEIEGHHLVVRHFAEGDALPAPWENPKTLRDSDVTVIHSDGHEVQPLMHLNHEAVEGLGFVMLATTTDVIPAKQAA